MSNNILKLSILTPHLHFFNNNVINLKTMDSKGPLEILPNHMALITLIKGSINEFTGEGGKRYRALLSDGILKIHDNTVTILCRSARWVEEIEGSQDK